MNWAALAEPKVPVSGGAYTEASVGPAVQSTGGDGEKGKAVHASAARRAAVTHSWEPWRTVRQAEASVRAGAFLFEPGEEGGVFRLNAKKPTEFTRWAFSYN